MTILTLALTMPAHALDVVVRPGDDIQAATSALGAGDVVTFEAGVYELKGTVFWSGLGTDDNPITFMARAGAEVILRNSGGGYVADVADSDWVVIENIAFEGAKNAKYNGTAGLRIRSSSNVRLRSLRIGDVWNTALRIEGDCSNINVLSSELGPAPGGDGISAGCGDAGCWLQDSIIDNNLIHDVGGTGINLLNGAQGNLVSDNVVFRTGGDGLVLPDTQFGNQNVASGNAIWQTEDDGIYVWGPALVQSNVVFETGDEGILTQDNDGSLLNVQISHNTVARTNGWAAQLNGWYDKEDMVFANNALANPTGYGFTYDDPLSDPYNYKKLEDTDNFIHSNVVTGLIQGFDPLVRPDFVIEGGGVGDFDDIDNFDFYPSVPSVLRDAGTPDGNAYIPVTDFNGVQRNGAAPTVGAYEYNGQGNPGWLLQEDFKDVDEITRRAGSQINTGCCGNNNSGGTQALLFGPLLWMAVMARRREG
ncbi:MAG: right-handed parallel beta-helix repeat-containing protein [Myxococcales bacterium]|nr:right-handed parallel beta-helix repeat-containing protein [Myxococcales bacterium]